MLTASKYSALVVPSHCHLTSKQAARLVISKVFSTNLLKAQSQKVVASRSIAWGAVADPISKICLQGTTRSDIVVIVSSSKLKCELTQTFENVTNIEN
jgi:hypothetical protein